VWGGEGSVSEPGREGRAVLGPEPVLVLRRELRLSLEPGLEPEAERARVVELLLSPARLRRGRLDADPGGGPVELRRLTVPAGGLVPRPGGGHSDEGEQDRLADLDQRPVIPRALVHLPTIASSAARGHRPGGMIERGYSLAVRGSSRSSNVPSEARRPRALSRLLTSSRSRFRDAAVSALSGSSCRCRR